MTGGRVVAARFAVVAVLGLLAFAGADLATRPPSVPAAPLVVGAELHVPRTAGEIFLDGDMDDPGWLRANPARTNAFELADGTNARPYSDARLVWGDETLYVALYAADQDIRASRTEPDSPLWLEDSFHLVFSAGDEERMIDVSPTGVVTDARRVGGVLDYGWSSGAHVSNEVDGTPNDPRDDDEEWVLEMAIPLDALGLSGEPGERIPFSVRRCDTPKHAARVCASWNGDGMGAGSDPSGVLVLD